MLVFAVVVNGRYRVVWTVGSQSILIRFLNYKFIGALLIRFV